MITQCMTTSFKKESFEAIHDFTTDTFYMALYDASASLGADTTVYATDGEVSGTGYTAGGTALTGVTVATSGTTAYVDFDDVIFTGVTARGALIYNASKANRAVAVLDFGSDKTFNNSTVQMPVASATTALLRFE